MTVSGDVSPTDERDYCTLHVTGLDSMNESKGDRQRMRCRQLYRDASDVVAEVGALVQRVCHRVAQTHRQHCQRCIHVRRKGCLVMQIMIIDVSVSVQAYIKL